MDIELPRVLPLLCKELITKSPPIQIRNLSEFERNFDLLSRVEITHDDAARFVAVLFRLIQHKECCTNLQRQQQWDVALVSIRILHKLFVSFHNHFPVFLYALQDIMKFMKLDNDHYYRRPSINPDELAQYGVRRLTPPAVGRLPLSTTPSESSFNMAEHKDKKGGDSLATAETPTSSGSPPPLPQTNTSSEMSVSTRLSSPTPYVPPKSPSHAQSHFLLPPQDKKSRLIPAGSATEITVESLEQLKMGFDDLDERGHGEITFDEMLKFAEACGREFSVQAFKKLDKDGSGTLSFVEIVRYWFPKVSLRELQKKIALLPDAEELKQKRQKEQLAEQLKIEAEIRKKKEAEEARLYEEYLEWKRELELRRRKAAIRFDDEKHARWEQFCQESGNQTVARLQKGVEVKQDDTITPYRTPQQMKVLNILDELHFRHEDMHLDSFLNRPETRAMCTELLQALDYSAVNVCYMLKHPNIHLYLPFRYNKRCKVYRDFLICPPAPKLEQPWRGQQHCHIKTNIPGKSDIMYRFVIEGYNYGVNAPIHCDVVGYAHRRWTKLGAMEDYGWPEQWDEHTRYEYCKGASVSQYMSSDEFVVIKLTAKSLFRAGFSVSAFMLNFDYGDDWVVAAEVVFAVHDL